MIVPIFLPHLGCGSRCIYCDQGSITNVHGGEIKDAVIRSLSSCQNTVEVGLYGGNIFGLGPSELSRLFENFNDYTRRISSFRISTKPVPLNSTAIGILKKSKVTVIELGIPSFNDVILQNLNRRHTVEDFYKAFYHLKGEGFRVAFQVMVGLPGETMHDIKETAAQVVRLSPHYLRIYPLVVLKDTPLHEMYAAGLMAPIQFKEALQRAAYIYLNALLHGIKVVKMGLTDNEIIKDRIVAGSYHPAFGYMVKSHTFYLAVKANIDAASMRGDVIVRLNGRDIPHLLGHRRSNLEALQKQEVRIRWEKAEIGQGDFILECGPKTTKGSVLDALKVL